MSGNSFVIERPPGAWAMLVLGHGARAGMRQPLLEGLAAALASEGVATLRYQFPFMDACSPEIDAGHVLEASVRQAVVVAGEADLPLFAGGKSMSGRVTSHAQAHARLPGVRGIVFVGFPLHERDRPNTYRADHLAKVDLPMLFLHGASDHRGSPELLRPIVERLPRTVLDVIDETDHAFELPPTSLRTIADVHAELARCIARWARPLARQCMMPLMALSAF